MFAIIIRPQYGLVGGLSTWPGCKHRNTIYTCHIITALCLANCSSIIQLYDMIPANKVHGTNMGLIWGRQDPVGPHVDPVNFALRDALDRREDNTLVMSSQGDHQK